MKTKELVTRISDNYAECVRIIEVKNHDYAGDEAFANFRFAKLVGVEEARGILVRMTDKIARVSNLLGKDPAVVGESVADTLNDLCNYAQILRVFLEDSREKTN